MNTQHYPPQSLEAAIALWEQHLNEFTILLSDAAPVLENADWRVEKKRVFVCESDGSKKRKQAASGPSYHFGVSLNRSDAELIWNRFQVFAGAAGLDEVERIPANEQEWDRTWYCLPSGKNWNGRASLRISGFPCRKSCPLRTRTSAP